MSRCLHDTHTLRDHPWLCVCSSTDTHPSILSPIKLHTTNTRAHTPVHVPFPGCAAVLRLTLQFDIFPSCWEQNWKYSPISFRGRENGPVQILERWRRRWNAPAETRRDRLNRFLAKLNLCQVSALLRTPWLRLLSRTNNSLLPLKTPVDLIDSCFCFSSFSRFYGGNVMSVSRRPKKTSDSEESNLQRCPIRHQSLTVLQVTLQHIQSKTLTICTDGRAERSPQFLRNVLGAKSDSLGEH